MIIITLKETLTQISLIDTKKVTADTQEKHFIHQEILRKVYISLQLPILLKTMK